MLKIIKRISCLYLAMVLLICVSVANVHAETHVDGNEESISTRYLPCSAGGKHKMASRGAGKAYIGKYPNTSNLGVSGYAFRCEGCGMVIISQYNPRYTGVTKLGKYAVGYSKDDLPITGTSMWIASADEIDVNNNLGTDDFTRGLEFIGSGNI